MTPQVTDKEILDAVAEAHQAGETDAFQGGVPPQAVAERTELERDTASERLTKLAKNGDLKQVWGVGVGPQKGPRRSYLPQSPGSKTKG